MFNLIQIKNANKFNLIQIKNVSNICQQITNANKFLNGYNNNFDFCFFFTVYKYSQCQ